MRGIGYFLGATLGAGLLFFIVSYIFLRPSEVNDKQISKFINDFNKIIIKKPIPFLSMYDGDDKRLGGDEISKMTYFSNRNMSYIRADTYTYFCKELNKYVKTYSINEGYMSGSLLDFGKKDKDRTIWSDMYFYYNKIQNADSTYGIIEKLLPILHFRSADPTLRSNNRDSDFLYLKEKYTENVKLHLEYFIDFKKLFPDS